MKYVYLLAFLAICLLSCESSTIQHEDPTTIPIESAKYRLTLLWETAAQLPTVESVIYDSVTNHLYTANIDGFNTEKDGKGSISKLSIDGKIIDANWVSGIHAPTGLGILEGKLYTTNIDEVMEVDMSSARVTNTISIPGAKSLNDLAIGPDGTIYCSDTDGNAIYALKADQITKVVEDINSPNGLYVSDNEFSVVCWNPKSLYQVNLGDQSMKTIASGMNGLDGLEPVGNGDYLVSSYFGKIYYVTKAGEKSLLLNTIKEEISAADIEYVPELKLLLVPTMESNKVMAYRLEKVELSEE